MCLSCWLQVSGGGGMWPSGLMASSSLLLLSLAAFLLECHRLGIFTARIFPSQSNRLQLEPRDSSWLGRGSWRGQWWMPGPPWLLCS